MITIGLSSIEDQKYLPSQNIQMQEYLNNILQWTAENRMQVNGKKTKLMIVNFTRNYQFSARLYLGDDLLEIVEETRLLGCIITSDLKFHRNTDVMIKKAYATMTIIIKLYSFHVPVEDLIHIYTYRISGL